MCCWYLTRRSPRKAGQSYVQVVSSTGTIEKRAIKTGITDYQYTEVTEGLSEGEKVTITQEYHQDDNNNPAATTGWHNDTGSRWRWAATGRIADDSATEYNQSLSHG